MSSEDTTGPSLKAWDCFLVGLLGWWLLPPSLVSVLPSERQGPSTRPSVSSAYFFCEGMRGLVHAGPARKLTRGVSPPFLCPSVPSSAPSCRQMFIICLQYVQTLRPHLGLPLLQEVF